MKLNLQQNIDGIFECRGHIQGHYPIYLPDDGVFTGKLVTHFDAQFLHGGVGLTTAKVRGMY